MSAATLPEPQSKAPGAGRAAAIVGGALLALIAVALLAAGAVGLWADTTQRDDDGWLSSPSHRFETSTRALTAEGAAILEYDDVLGSIRPGARPGERASREHGVHGA